MPKLSLVSINRLATCDPRLQIVCEIAIEIMDFAVISGHRNQADQDAAFAAGTSKIKWPNGKHNKNPSQAVDLAPYPLDWSNKPKAVARFYLLAGVILAVADILRIKIRWGGDWDGDWDLFDQNFDDLGHFEIVED